ncbi:glycogen/starch/alpha-glucan phosphorylase [Aneurinibacillus sp. Ricciae_BoGa-3]|uniref:glycogen/starch/alpha-glucan phosphorylase n=1 Tax=Aneurinibacillus sp. Ricciae_BoGa-3 TaxID=3022697 RepID=UPI0023414676|nr:glycogen/starch/alpha-glucan phosphorylase [Aneurinibacillus sp. Ricciae_BoGa-3]WCK52694.1 glycogen/starch/alpha-glucan phosphorylase [Aneurinibacillus sp. Ricciae_BoGa-3]
MFTNIESFKTAFTERLESLQGEFVKDAAPIDQYKALGSLIREHITRNWIETNACYQENKQKQVYYFSMEFLPGKFLSSNLINLGIRDMCQQGLADLRIDLDELEGLEPDAGLGNGGLGRLAACFMDSLASTSLPGHGCGIRYKYGLFEQKIVDGYQVELPEYWLKEGNVWEIRRSDRAVEVRFGGNVFCREVNGKLTFFHENYEPVLAVPYDMPMIGYDNKTVNTLRLWSAESTVKDFDFQTLNRRDYHKMLAYKRSIEQISEFLYPDDSYQEGKVLRLKQQYFLVSAGLQSVLRSFKKMQGESLYTLHQKVAVHINDTHPVLAIPELMRLLMDEEGMGWDEAWHITTQVISYTNHTTLVEALEKWPIDIFQPLLPRIYMIVEEINERFCHDLWNRYPGDWDRIHSMAILADGQVKMAHLAIVGSHSVNGVAKLHTEILKHREMKNFYDLSAEKFNNKTNGITHRRWLIKANPALSRLITDAIGEGWKSQPAHLVELMSCRKDASLQESTMRIKQENKAALAKIIQEKTGIRVDVNSIFDVQVKRLHAYKRQTLNILHIMDLYNRLRDNPDLDLFPRTFIFGAKAAPGYQLAKSVIKLINTVASVINGDKLIQDKLKVVFLENYRVSLAEKIIPAADISEQISTASKEASGTGNMKFMMNGAITLGTLDGANIEIREEVGDDNIFIFGLKAEEVLDYNRHGGYRAKDLYNSNPRIRRILDQLVNGFFQQDHAAFNDIYYSLLTSNDEFFVLKDFTAYADAQQRVEQAYRDKAGWAERAIVNIARSGVFSSDRTVAEYASDIWNVHPVSIP